MLIRPWTVLRGDQTSNAAEGSASAPTLSIVIPAYNVAPYVAAAIDSALAMLNQTSADSGIARVSQIVRDLVLVMTPTQPHAGPAPPKFASQSADVRLFP